MRKGDVTPEITDRWPFPKIFPTPVGSPVKVFDAQLDQRRGFVGRLCGQFVDTFFNQSNLSLGSMGSDITFNSAYSGGP